MLDKMLTTNIETYNRWNYRYQRNEYLNIRVHEDTR